MSFAGELIPLVIIAAVAVHGYLKGVKIFSVFTEGAKKGLSTALSILPTLIGIVTGISMLSASGALDALANCLAPLCSAIGFPQEVVPLALLRPISGSGANSAVIQIFESLGPDSLQGRLASVLASSTETTFYAISVYFTGRSFRRLRYTVPAALIGDFAAIVFSLLAVRFF